MEPGPTGSNTGRSWFLLSSGCDSSGYYSVAHGMGLSPNDTQFPCRTLVACLDQADTNTLTHNHGTTRYLAIARQVVACSKEYGEKSSIWGSATCDQGSDAPPPQPQQKGEIPIHTVAC